MEEDSRFAKCNKCEVKYLAEVTTFTPTNLVNYLKTKHGHKEENEEYNKLKKENEEKTKCTSTATTSNGTRLKQVSLQGSAEMRKIPVWDINDS